MRIFSKKTMDPKYMRYFAVEQNNKWFYNRAEEIGEFIKNYFNSNRDPGYYKFIKISFEEPKGFSSHLYYKGGIEKEKACTVSYYDSGEMDSIVISPPICYGVGTAPKSLEELEQAIILCGKRIKLSCFS